MIHHMELGADPTARSKKIKALITTGQVRFGGNKNLKIYGALSCSSGKRMKVANRVFFATEGEAIRAGYRPCGHCMRGEYLRWKADAISGDDEIPGADAMPTA